MSLELLAGRTYGPLQGTISATKSAEYVAATGDDPERWTSAAPPSFAAALLFSIAPALITDPDIGDNTKVLVHADQTFRWHEPLRHGTAVTIAGEVSRVRQRSGLNFVTFDVDVAASGAQLMQSTSTFLMGSEAAAEPGEDVGEPPVDHGSVRLRPEVQRTGDGEALPALDVAASRLDLVRYAGASGDFNPIHFDHDAARAAGLDGIVVHGLLMAAWMTRYAAAVAPSGDAPLREIKLRFRQALRPAVTATLSGSVKGVDDAGDRRLALALASGGIVLVTATATVRKP